MAIVNLKVKTRVPLVGRLYPNWNAVIHPAKNPLPAWTPFDITEIRRVAGGKPGTNDTNTVWVKSGAGHWYPYSEGAFLGRSATYCDDDLPVHISPAGPSWLPNWNGTPSSARKPHPGAMYAIQRPECPVPGAPVRWTAPYV